MKSSKNDDLLTFGGHLEVLRQMLFRIIAVAGAVAMIVFCFKETTWEVLLAPSEWDFCTYRWLERMMQVVGIGFRFEEFHVNLIATDLSSQFMTHVTTAVYLGRYSVQVAGIIYVLFILGVLMSYFVLFPISFRFLGTYSVSARVVSNITLDSYVTSFVSLTLVMGVVFQLPVIAFFLGKLGVVSSEVLLLYRKHAFVVIMMVAAVITPPDLMTLILVTIPLYMLYEVSIRVVKFVER